MTDAITTLGDYSADEWALIATSDVTDAADLAAATDPAASNEPELVRATLAAAYATSAGAHATLALAATIREAAASITAALQQTSDAPPWLVPASSGTNLSPVRVTRNGGGACMNCGVKPGFKHEPGCVHDGHEHRSDMCVEEGTR